MRSRRGEPRRRREKPGPPVEQLSQGTDPVLHEAIARVCAGR